MKNIPKIIHQIAPRDKSLWDEKWHVCQKSWIDAIEQSNRITGSETIEYRMWTDEDLDQFVRESFPDLYPFYMRYIYNISRIDFARYLILQTFGGVYADMDYEYMEPVMNLWNISDDFDVAVVESPFPNNEYVQNSFMMSTKGHKFWEFVIHVMQITTEGTILDTTGPRMLSKCVMVARKNGIDVHVLDKKVFNPSYEDQEAFNAPSVITRHHGTMIWFKRNGSALGR